MQAPPDYDGFEGANHVIVNEREAPTCPRCLAKPFKVSGKNMRIADDDRSYISDAHCVSCGKYVGSLITVVNTIFGIREDQAVLNGRCRVY